MPVIRAHAEVRAPSTQVWQVLSDFQSFDSWHPLYTILGQANFNEVLKLVLHRFPQVPEGFAVPARVLVFQPPSALGWRFGIPFLIWIDERYRLTPTPAGTLVDHEIALRGLLSWPVRWFASARISHLLSSSDDKLEARVRAVVKQHRLASIVSSKHGARRVTERSWPRPS